MNIFKLKENLNNVFLFKLEGYVSANRDRQFNLLKDIWFGMYPRNRGNIGSSGFEHVFLNEMKYGSPIGLHNWIYFHHKENTTNQLDYNGYMDSLLLGNVSRIKNEIDLFNNSV